MGTASSARSELDALTPPVLALHGFGGTPDEVELVLEVARSIGLRGRAPLLPGHGASRTELARTRFADWLAGAREALHELTSRGERAIVVGFSLGSLLAIRLAVSEQTRVAALGLLANALWLAPPITVGLELMRWTGAPDLWLPRRHPEPADPVLRVCRVAYQRHPTRAAVDLLRGARATRPLVARVQVPALLVHGRDDGVCPLANARWAAAKLPRSRLVVLPRSAHVLTRGRDRDVLFGELRAHFEAAAAADGARRVTPL